MFFNLSSLKGALLFLISSVFRLKTLSAFRRVTVQTLRQEGVIQRKSEGVWREEDALLSRLFSQVFSPTLRHHGVLFLHQLPPPVPSDKKKIIIRPRNWTRDRNDWILSPFGLFLIWRQKSETLQDAAAAAAAALWLDKLGWFLEFDGWGDWRWRQLRSPDGYRYFQPERDKDKKVTAAFPKQAVRSDILIFLFFLFLLLKLDFFTPQEFKSVVTAREGYLQFEWEAISYWCLWDTGCIDTG